MLLFSTGGYVTFLSVYVVASLRVQLLLLAILSVKVMLGRHNTQAKRAS